MKKKVILVLISSVLLISVGLAAFGAADEKYNVNQISGTKAVTANADNSFDDVEQNQWYTDAINWCVKNGIMSGISENKFSPDTSLSRAMLAAVLYRNTGSPNAEKGNFSDVDNNEWYADAVNWASQNNIILGYSDFNFGPNDYVTREQLAAILYRYSNSPNVTEEFNVSNVSPWAKDSVNWAIFNKVLNERENGYAVNESASRADVAYAVYAVLAYQNNNSNDSEEENNMSSANERAVTVYFTSDISSNAILKLYNSLDKKLEGNKIAVKLSTGEPGSNYLRPELIKDIVQLVNGTIVECNTAYGGQRAETAMHYQVAKDHGFNDIADVVIMDENGSITLPVEGGTNIKENYVGAKFADYDGFIVLSHFKGHAMGGFGGAIKNISIGIASSEGKSFIHSGGKSRTNPWGGEQNAFLESMAEAGKSVVDSLDGNIVYINVMNRLSVDCDCDGNPAEPDMHDIGILASTDPVALDQACVDLVYNSSDDGKASLIERIETRNGIHTLEHADKIGLGTRNYNLVNLDD